MADSQKFQHMADAGLGNTSATVTSLPIGYTLGMVRFDNGVEYRLTHNAGTTAIAPGLCGVIVPGGGPYSVTVSSVSGSFQEIGAVVNNNTASVATAAYFWGARKGFIASGLVASAVCIPSGSAFQISINGNFIVLPQSVVTGVAAAGMALVTILSTTSGGGKNGTALLDLR